MRILQVVIFALGVVFFLAALGFMGQETGNTLWKAGVAFMLMDLVCMALWPSAKTS